MFSVTTMSMVSVVPDTILTVTGGEGACISQLPGAKEMSYGKHDMTPKITLIITFRTITFTTSVEHLLNFSCKQHTLKAL